MKSFVKRIIKLEFLLWKREEKFQVWFAKEGDK